MLYLILILAALAFLCYFYLLLPSDMAKKRGRGVVEWVIIFWIISPLWGIILLWLLGDNPNRTDSETE